MSPGSGCLWMTVWEWPTLISSLTPSSQNAPRGPPSEPFGLGKSWWQIFYFFFSHLTLNLCMQFAVLIPTFWRKHTKMTVCSEPLSFTTLKKKKTVLFIFGCPRSLVLSTLFSSWGKRGALCAVEWALEGVTFSGFAPSSRAQAQ